MRPRAAGLAVLLFICFAALFCTGAAAETGSVLSIADAPETVRRGSAFRIELAPAHQDLSAFVLFAEYDSADIERAEAEFSGAFDADYTYVSAQEGRIAVVYTAENGRTAPQDGRIVFTFKTKSDALSDTLPVRFTVTDAASGDAQPLLGAPQTLDAEPAFQPAPSSDSALLSLLPPEGKLSPAFDPDIFDYTLEVPYSSTSLVERTSAAMTVHPVIRPISSARWRGFGNGFGAGATIAQMHPAGAHSPMCRRVSSGSSRQPRSSHSRISSRSESPLLFSRLSWDSRSYSAVRSTGLSRKSVAPSFSARWAYSNSG